MEIIAPHENVSRLVTPEDIEKVYKDAEEIAPLLNKQLGRYPGFYAIAHPQVEKDRPLRFFVINPRAGIFNQFRSIVIINPVITNHTNSTIDSIEGCATFSKFKEKTVQRWNKVEVEFSDLEFDQEKKPLLGKRKKLSLNGRLSKVFQHEIDHLDAKYIYDLK